MESKGYSLAEQNSVGGTPLHSACAVGSVACASILLNHGIGVDCEDKYPFCPIASSLFPLYLIILSMIPTDTEIPLCRNLFTNHMKSVLYFCLHVMQISTTLFLCIFLFIEHLYM